MEPSANAKIAEPGLIYPWPAAASLGTAIEVAPGVLWATLPIPFPPRHINVWLLADGVGWAAVDCGYGDAQTRAAWQALLADVMSGAPVRRLIVTHCHPDHIGNAQWLAARFGLIPWMTKSEYLLAHAAYHRTSGNSRAALLALNEHHGVAPERLAGLNPPADGYRRGVPELPDAFHRIKDGETIDIGARTWQVIVGHGHSPEHAALYCATLGVLISGDMLLPRISTHVGVWPMEPDADPVGEFLASVARLAALPADTLVLPSHGLPFRGAGVRAAQLMEHHRCRLRALVAACGEPRTAAELLPVLFEREFDNQQFFFAMGETIAHLNHLMRRGELARSPRPVHRFQRRTAAH